MIIQGPSYVTSDLLEQVEPATRRGRACVLHELSEELELCINGTQKFSDLRKCVSIVNSTSGGFELLYEYPHMCNVGCRSLNLINQFCYGRRRISVPAIYAKDLSARFQSRVCQRNHCGYIGRSGKQVRCIGHGGMQSDE